MEEQIIIHKDQKYRIVFEQAASTKGVIGFKVEVNGDDKALTQAEAENILVWAKGIAPAITVEVK